MIGKWLMMVLAPVFLSAACPDTDVIVIGTDVADYDGKEMILSGEVAFEHSMGTIVANQARIVKEDKKALSLLRLEGDIKVFMWEGGTFRCACADLSHKEMSGSFYGDGMQEYVTYTDNLEDSKGDSVPIVVRGKHMVVNVDQSWTEHSHPKTHAIGQIIADNNVTVDYDKEFMAAGDHMIYRRVSAVDSDALLPGMIDLFPDEGLQGVCQVTSRQGDIIKAERIAIDLPKQLVAFNKPKGAIYVTHNEEDLQRVDFSADHLVWNQPADLLTLQDNVALYQKRLGKLTSTDKVQVCHSVTDSSRELKWISSSGKTELNYDENDRGLHHCLICYGPVFIDPITCVTRLQSPRDGDSVQEGKQVFFSDRKRQIFADSVVLEYAVDQGGMEPKKLVLEGSVRIMNDSFFDAQYHGNSLQYALADVVEYFPDTQAMHMYARGDKRVLFYDCLNGVQISAPAVNVRKDNSSGKKAVEGVGDVRMTFAENEIKTLVDSFDLLKSYW